ncbi:hypothetical protein PBY51_021965 [Eleginops maclovinus]|uniref:Uncharacterized protein n=1 Tax=Eleginops maclovinus TaxID=56733 RepID=A0AAN7XFS1_ELEMC|nr:hypothetical protein PBY51_021965 [Eleginops maclovinus]
MIFGSGIGLQINTEEVSLPSYYKLEGDHGSVCLATGFNNITYARKENSLFHRTSAVRIRYDKLYNHLAYLSSGNETCETGNTPDVCVDTLKPDPQVNMASLTVLGLRLLFLKTVVFNVLLTLRLWMTSCEQTLR